MIKKKQPVILRGYIKKENGGFVAVCIDLNIVAQGKTQNEAIHECVELISEYLNYIQKEYPDDFEKYVPRQTPNEFVKEYDAIVGKTLNPKKHLSGKMPYNFPIEPETLSFCYTQTLTNKPTIDLKEVRKKLKKLGFVKKRGKRHEI